MPRKTASRKRLDASSRKKKARDLPLVVVTASPHMAGQGGGPLSAKRRELASFLVENKDFLRSRFRIKSTGGFYDWIDGGYKSDAEEATNYGSLYEQLRKDFDIKRTSYGGQAGGIVELANEVVRGSSRVVFLFISNLDLTGIHSPANQALARICDYKNVPIYFNSASAGTWVQALRAGVVRPEHYLPEPDLVVERLEKEELSHLADKIPRSIASAGNRARKDYPIAKRTLALISHDEYKESMRDFVLFFERTLQEFGRIITTGTTGERILDLVPSLRPKLLRYESGPKGGDIRIAFEILAGKCHHVVFFMDPLRAHPHAADIRVLTLACNETDTHIITNQTAAKDWINLLSPPLSALPRR